MISRVWLDGEFQPDDVRARATIERRLELANGCFETLLVRDGIAHELAIHLERLAMSVSVTVDRAAIKSAVRQLTAECSGVARLRIVVSESPYPGTAITVTDYVVPGPADLRDGVSVTVLSAPTVERRDPSRARKTLEWRRRAADLNSSDAFECLLLNDANRVAEGLRSNVIAVVDGRPVTPALDEGCLPGTVRRRLVESGAVAEGVVDSRALHGGELMLANSLIGVVPVAEVDGRPMIVGQWAKELRSRWTETCANG